MTTQARLERISEILLDFVVVGRTDKDDTFVDAGKFGTNCICRDLHWRKQ